MKKIIIAIIIIVINVTMLRAQVTTVFSKDTLGWLQMHIQADSNYFKGKSFSVLYDSLYGLKSKLYSFRHPSNVINGSVFLNSALADTISIFFGDLYSARVWSPHDSITRANWANGVNWRDGPIPTINTHLIYIQISFTNPKMYNFSWVQTDKLGLGSFKWNIKLAKYFSNCIVQSVKIGEY